MPDIKISPRRLTAIVLTIALITVSGAFFVSRSHSNPKQGPLRVIAAENFWGDIAKQLGGNKVTVTSIISDPEVDPHLYESNALNASAVGTADVVITNGLGYDAFMDKLIDLPTPRKRSLITVADVYQISDAGANPHLWFDIPRIHLLAERITKAYIAQDPANTTYYLERAETFDEAIQDLDNSVAAVKHRHPAISVAYTEPLPAYLLEDLGMIDKTPANFAKSMENATEPNPADVAAFEELITTKAISILFYNAQATSPATNKLQTLAEQYAIPIIGITETQPQEQLSYQAWQQSILDAISNALSATTL